MGGGGTLVEGIRRLFQRRASNSVETHNNANNSRVYVRDLRAQLPSIPNHHHLVDPDFDFSTLKPIKVPAQIPFRPSSMDLHKKMGVYQPEGADFLDQDVSRKKCPHLICDVVGTRLPWMQETREK
ncbi:hypothetical protein ACSQ67_005339 [Phaseolus vulgaris]